MAMKCIKKVEIYIIYIKCCQVLKIFPNFIIGSAGYGAKDKS